MENANNYGAGALAFVGDAVYSLLVRSYLADINRQNGTLHEMSMKYVSAPAQAKAFSIIEDKLSEKELAVFKRGRNFQTGNTPKSATRAEYAVATGLECLFGFLHLSGKTERISELFKIITENME